MFLCKVLAGFRSTVFPAAPGREGFTSGGSATAGDIIFYSIPQTRFRHNVAIAICRTLHSPYPAGDGNIAILCSILPESRRVRWLSASGSQ